MNKSQQSTDEKRLQNEKEWHNRLANNEFSDALSKKLNHGAVLYLCLDRLEEYATEGLDKNKTVLDYCCGDNAFLIENASIIKEGIGIDISDVLIAKQNEKREKEHIQNIKFEVMDAMNTSFPDNMFDVIYAKAVLHHLDVEEAMYEIKRILKKGGEVFIQEPLGTNPVIALYRKMTPQYRTVDECAFMRKDIKTIRQHFPKMEIEYYLFFALLAFPFRNLKIFKKIANALFQIDKLFLHKRSPFKWLAWCCIMRLQK